MNIKLTLKATFYNPFKRGNVNIPKIQLNIDWKHKQVYFDIDCFGFLLIFIVSKK